MRNRNQTLNKRIWKLPTSIPSGNVKMWLDPDNEQSYNMSDLNVNYINERSSNAYQFLKNIDANRPIIINKRGRKFLRFDVNKANTLIATGTSSAFNFIHNGSNHTIFLVFGTIANTADGSHSIIGNTNGSTLQVGFGINHVDSSDTLQFAANKGVSGQSFYNRTSVNFTPAQINYVFQVYNSSVPQIGSAVNTATMAYTAVTNTPSLANAFKDLTLGTTTSQARGVDFGDIIIMDILLNSTQIQDLIDYATLKYNTLPF